MDDKVHKQQDGAVCTDQGYQYAAESRSISELSLGGADPLVSKFHVIGFKYCVEAWTPRRILGHSAGPIEFNKGSDGSTRVDG